ncbi:FAD-binding oxidoreductase [Pseudonocardia kunmingensis]|uniref:FAD/FMN-containing dehydrogenase n=1 Tax=Pseudonocardia kunmingensis TaxID=630975 RepID=A0A543D964_9PSEU|nr:FAD-binding oxidoreductase [Pseudonocardia kunmingensis]TQM05835.1 FAD/FMN-containing dehydrogenase [Pseudonocardia kunmingensis]
MTSMLSEFDELRATMTGAVVGPGDQGYDEVRRVWNAAIDRSPAVVARCTSAADVCAAVAFARERGLEIAVRGGAHNPAGTAVVDGGLMIDLSLLDDVAVDAGTRRARVGGGATLAQLDTAAQQHGLAVPAGMISHTGVAGLTLGGGMGWLTRRHGLAVDNLVSVQVVTADGRVLRAADDENPDLFWAVRGGGGNFGVVTEFEFRLHEVGPIVQVGMLFFALDEFGAAVRTARDTLPALSRDINVLIAGVHAPPAPFVPEEHRLQPAGALVVVGFGSAEEHADALGRLRSAAPPLFEMATPMPYVALQQMFDEGNAWGFHCYEKGTYVADLSDEVIDVIAEHLPRKVSPLSVLMIYRLDGAFSETAEEATAFGGSRAPHYQAFIVGLAPSAEDLDGERRWVRELWAALQPHTGDEVGYLNGLIEFDDERVRAVYGPKYDRLAAIKAAYDPANLFHHNANIRPASG